VATRRDNDNDVDALLCALINTARRSKKDGHTSYRPIAWRNSDNKKFTPLVERLGQSRNLMAPAGQIHDLALRPGPD